MGNDATPSLLALFYGVESAVKRSQWGRTLPSAAVYPLSIGSYAARYGALLLALQDRRDRPQATGVRSAPFERRE